MGLVRDALVGPLVVVAAGGTLVEILGQRRVALPPLDEASAAAMLDQPLVARLLAGADGGRPTGRLAGGFPAIVDAVLAVSQIAIELGDVIEALDVNPLLVSAAGGQAVAVDALIIPRPS